MLFVKYVNKKQLFTIEDHAIHHQFPLLYMICAIQVFRISKTEPYVVISKDDTSYEKGDVVFRVVAQPALEHQM